MMTVTEFALPDLGEGLTESQLVAWRVHAGDTVALNQTIAEVETAKALVELPSPYAGIVAELYAQPGDTVQVGERLIGFALDGDAAQSSGSPDAAPDRDAAGVATDEERGAAPTETGGAPAADAAAADAAAADAAAAGGADAAGGPATRGADAAGGPAAGEDGRVPNLVGYGAKAATGARPVRRPRRLPEAASDTVAEPAAPSRPADAAGAGAPGVDAAGADVAHADDAGRGAGAGAAEGDGTWRTPIVGVRKHTAEAMVRSAFTAPHVTTFLTVDVTRTVKFLRRVRDRAGSEGVHVTILTAVARALCLAVPRTPEVNTSWDGEAGEIVHHDRINLGIAAATPRGLMVPTIKDAGALSLDALAAAITELVRVAKAGRCGPEDLAGGTISITNVGVFGVDAGTPILNPGEAAILAMGAVRKRPWEHKGALALRDVMTLSLSFDHRLVDGEQGSRFLADIGRILTDPREAFALC